MTYRAAATTATSARSAHAARARRPKRVRCCQSVAFPAEADHVMLPLPHRTWLSRSRIPRAGSHHRPANLLPDEIPAGKRLILGAELPRDPAHCEDRNRGALLMVTLFACVDPASSSPTGLMSRNLRGRRECLTNLSKTDRQVGPLRRPKPRSPTILSQLSEWLRLWPRCRRELCGNSVWRRLRCNEILAKLLSQCIGE